MAQPRHLFDSLIRSNKYIFFISFFADVRYNLKLLRFLVKLEALGVVNEFCSDIL
jgi:hypothetical protein